MLRQVAGDVAMRAGLASALVGAAALAFCMGGAAPAKAAGCQLVKVAELPVVFKANRPKIQVSINGKTGWFLVDTGASNTMMFGGAAQNYGLRISSERGAVYGVGGGQDLMSTVIGDFSLGDVRVKDFKLFVIGHEGSADDAGIFGRDVLGHYDLEFDLANSRVRLFQPRGCSGTSLAYWTTTPQVADLQQGDWIAPFEIKLLVNGKPVLATLDSGATTSIVTPEVAEIGRPQDDGAKADPARVRGIGEATVESHVATFDTVAIEGELVRNARLRVADMFANDKASETGSRIPRQIEGLPRMLLGADFFRSHRVLIATSQHLLYFTYSGGHVFQEIGDASAPGGTAPAQPTPAPGH